MKTTAWSLAISSVVIVLLVAATAFLARRPYYNWDMFPYMALAMDQADLPIETLHKRVYRLAQDYMLPSDFNAISSRQPELMKDAHAFEAVLPYFQIKPGYVLVVSGLYNFGVHPLAATWIPSIISYLAIGLMLFFWMRRTGPVFVAGVLTLLIMATPVMTNLARYSSPDMLCAALTLLALLFILNSKTTAGLSFLLASVTVRPDAAVLGVLIIAALWFSKRIILLQALSWVGGQLAILYFEFQDAGLISEYLVLDLGFSERLLLYANSPLRSLILPLLAVAFATILMRRKQKHPELLSLLAWAAVISIAGRIVLHPYVEDRFNLPTYLVILIVAWETVSAQFFTPNGLKPNTTGSA